MNKAPKCDSAPARTLQDSRQPGNRQNDNAIAREPSTATPTRLEQLCQMPSHLRVNNEYTFAPSLGQAVSIPAIDASDEEDNCHNNFFAGAAARSQRKAISSLLPSTSQSTNARIQSLNVLGVFGASPLKGPSVVISKQPVVVPSPFVKQDGAETENTILCTTCGKCTCTACHAPRRLPTKWICSKRCECSSLCWVDHLSCMCCIRAFFYHSFNDARDGSEGSINEHPCACTEQPYCCSRWLCITLASLCLPCLLCYWPLKFCVECADLCYDSCQKQRGCHCSKLQPLLVEAETSSS